MFKTIGMVLSVASKKEVTIVEQNGNNNCVAYYNGVKCTAIYNPFSNLYYVDDVYGVIG